MAPWYDNPMAMRNKLDTLEGLNELIDARHEAGYDRKERLQEWVVLGSLYMDTCGNTMKMDAKYSDMLVISRHDLVGKRWSASMGCDVPAANSICPHCSKGWGIHDWHGAKRVNRDIDVDEDCVGKTVQQLHDDLNAKGSGKSYYVHDSIQNTNLVDLRPNPRYADSEYMKGYPTNPYGNKYVKRDYIIEEGDRLTATVFEYYHVDCLAEHKADRELNHFRGIFSSAGFESFELKAIANEYCGTPSCCPPWYKVTTSLGTFKIGWRKRVINLVWPKDLNALRLFSEEDVTKGSTYIHAWGERKAIEYLRAIRKEFK